MPAPDVIGRWRQYVRGRPLGRAVEAFFICWAVYALLGYLSLTFLNKGDGVAALWPASGFAAGLAVVLGRSTMGAVALGVAAATLTIHFDQQSNVPIAVVFAACNAVECILFAVLLRWFDQSQALIESFTGVIAFFLAASMAAVLAAIPAALALNATGSARVPLEVLWFRWFVSDLIGILFVAPALMTFRSFVASAPSGSQVAEGIAAVAVAILAAMITFASVPLPAPYPYLAPAAFLLPILLWLSARTHPFFSSLALLGAAVAACLGALMGSERFGGLAMPLETRLTMAEVSIITASLAVLTLASTFARLKRTVAALESSDQRLKLALSDERIFAFDFDPQRDRIHRSGGLIHRLGLRTVSSSEAFFQLIHPDDIANFLAKRSSLSPAVPAVTMEYRVIAPTGDLIIIQQITEGVFDTQGKLVRMVGTCLDVTEREVARRAIETRERQLQQALTAGRIYTFEYDSSTQTITRSQNAASILGLPATETMADGGTLLRRLSRDDRRVLAQAIENLTEANPHMSVVVSIPDDDGNVMWGELVATAHHDEAGVQTGITGIVRDITRAKRAEDMRAQVIDELDHRVKNALDRMLGVILLSRVGETDVDAFAKALERRILSMAKTHERLSSSNWDGVDVGTLVDDELSVFRTGTNCTVDGAGVVLPPTAAQALSFTLHELATNAAKYGGLSTPGGRVAVCWGLEDGADGSYRLRLRWDESCEFPIVPPTRGSYGLMTIRGLLPREVRGSRVELNFKQTGLECVVDIALKSKPVVLRTVVAVNGHAQDAAE